MITEEQAKQHIRELLEYIGEDPMRTGLQDTPDRMIRMFGEMFRGYDPAQAPVVTTFPNGQDGIVYDDMVVDSGPFYSVCEHHCRTFFGEYWFAYLPNPKGRILGLSKIGRVVDYCASRLQVQERLVHDVVEMLTAEERQWLDDYHQMVFDRLSPCLDEEECRWLRQATRPIA